MRDMDALIASVCLVHGQALAKGVARLRRTLRRRGLVVAATLLGEALTERLSVAAPPSLLGTLGKLAVSGSVAAGSVGAPWLVKLGGVFSRDAHGDQRSARPLAGGATRACCSGPWAQKSPQICGTFSQKDYNLVSYL